MQHSNNWRDLSGNFSVESRRLHAEWLRKHLHQANVVSSTGGQTKAGILLPSIIRSHAEMKAWHAAIVRIMPPAMARCLDDMAPEGIGRIGSVRRRAPKRIEGHSGAKNSGPCSIAWSV